MSLDFNPRAMYDSGKFFEYPHLHRIVNEQLKTPSKGVIIPDNFGQQRKITNGFIHRCVYQMNIIIKRILHSLHISLSKPYRMKFHAASDKIVTAYNQKTSTIVKKKLNEAIKGKQETLKAEEAKLKAACDTIKGKISPIETEIQGLNQQVADNEADQAKIEVQKKPVEALIELERLKEELKTINEDKPFDRKAAEYRIEKAKCFLAKLHIERQILRSNIEKDPYEKQLARINLDLQYLECQIKSQEVMVELMNSINIDMRKKFGDTLGTISESMKEIETKRDKPEHAVAYDVKASLKAIRDEFVKPDCTLEASLATLNGELETLKTSMKTLEATTKTKQTELKTLKEQLSEAEKSYKKVARI